MYLVFYDKDTNEIRGQGYYSNPAHIPNQHSHFETTEELIKSGYPLEIYTENGKLAVRINNLEQAKIDAKKQKIELIKQKAEAGQTLSNQELAFLLINKDSL